MSSESISFTINARTARRASLHGREHLVVPTVLIVPGVLNGSRGPLLYEARDVAASVDAWNGMPVVVYHPQSGATSARSPQVSDKQKVGEVYNTRIDKGRLVADVWIDVARAQKVDRRVLDSVESGRPLEVSTGLLVDQVPARNGSHLNGKAYWSIARNFRPDHLAILPDQVGACSIKDGCGMLMNSARPVIPRVVNNAMVANCDGDKTCKACAAKKRGKKWVPMNNVRDPKVGRCVDDVVKTGKDKVAAIRICQASVGRAYHPKGG